MTPQALIMMRGGRDLAMRTFCSGMIGAGLATRADFAEAWGMWAEGGEVESDGGTGRLVLLQLPAENVSLCLEQLRAEVEGAHAIALPVLASL